MIDRRRFLAGSALLALTTQATGASAQAPSPEKKTYVLVPGAFWGGWVWRRVEPKLQSAGHRVFSVTNTGLGERSHLLSREVNLDTFVKDVLGVFTYNDISAQGLEIVDLDVPAIGLQSATCATLPSDGHLFLAYPVDSIAVDNARRLLALINKAFSELSKMDD